MTTRSRSGAGRALLAAALLVLAPAAGAEEEPASIDRDHHGFPYYRQYCASCHGIFADGKGPTAESMKEKPGGLTHLTEEFGSPLSPGKLAEFIEGEAMPRAHGRSDMPVWGKMLRSEMGPSLGNMQARRMIVALLVDYLTAIQQPGEPESSGH